MNAEETSAKNVTAARKVHVAAFTGAFIFSNRLFISRFSSRIRCYGGRSDAELVRDNINHKNTRIPMLIELCGPDLRISVAGLLHRRANSWQVSNSSTYRTLRPAHSRLR